MEKLNLSAYHKVELLVYGQRLTKCFEKICWCCLRWIAILLVQTSFYHILKRTMTYYIFFLIIHWLGRLCCHALDAFAMAASSWRGHVSQQMMARKRTLTVESSKCFSINSSPSNDNVSIEVNNSQRMAKKKIS
jgi:hypothetical protein